MAFSTYVVDKKNIVAYQLKLPLEGYKSLDSFLHGVEYQIDSEHFQYISISNLNSIKESEIELEKVLLDYSLMVKNVVDYKL